MNRGQRTTLIQRALAVRLNREQNYVARIETGQRRVDVVELIQICRACGADPEAEIAGLVNRLVDTLPKQKTKGGDKRKPSKE